MKVSVSEINLFLQDQLDWKYAYIDKRVPRRFDVALEVGSFWHLLMEEFYRKSRSKPAAMKHGMEHLSLSCPENTDIDKYAKYVEESTRLMKLFDGYWSDPAPESVIHHIEQPLEMDSQIEDVQIVGTPDCIIQWQDKWWHMQHRTLSDRTNLPIYFEAAKRDLHELVYAKLCCHHFGLKEHQWGGTLFNIVRKLSQKRIDESPESAFVYQFIPIDWYDVQEATWDVRQIVCDMQAISDGNRIAVQNRQWDKGRFGNYLSPYFRVKTGEVRLDDDSLFMNAVDRYATVEEE